MRRQTLAETIKADPDFKRKWDDGTIPIREIAKQYVVAVASVYRVAISLGYGPKATKRAKYKIDDHEGFKRDWLAYEITVDEIREKYGLSERNLQSYLNAVGLGKRGAIMSAKRAVKYPDMEKFRRVYEESQTVKIAAEELGLSLSAMRSIAKRHGILPRREIARNKMAALFPDTPENREKWVDATSIGQLSDDCGLGVALLKDLALERGWPRRAGQVPVVDDRARIKAPSKSDAQDQSGRIDYPGCVMRLASYVSKDCEDVVSTLKKTGGKYDAMNGLIEAWDVPSARLMQCYHAAAAL